MGRNLQSSWITSYTRTYTILIHDITLGVWDTVGLTPWERTRMDRGREGHWVRGVRDLWGRGWGGGEDDSCSGHVFLCGAALLWPASTKKSWTDGWAAESTRRANWLIGAWHFLIRSAAGEDGFATSCCTYKDWGIELVNLRQEYLHTLSYEPTSFVPCPESECT